MDDVLDAAFDPGLSSPGCCLAEEDTTVKALPGGGMKLAVLTFALRWGSAEWTFRYDECVNGQENAAFGFVRDRRPGESWWSFAASHKLSRGIWAYGK